MNRFYKFLVTAVVLVLLASCSNDDDSALPLPLGDYQNGVLILNEGNSSGGSVSFLNSDFTILASDVFANVNNVQGPGLFVQSIFFDETRAFIVSNGSNVINVVNRFTFELIGTIDTGLDVPRYGVVYNGKAYVTNQSSFMTDQDDFLAVVNLDTYSVENSLIIGGTGELIETIGTQLFLQNAAFGFGNTLRRFDPSTEQFSAPLTVGDGLNSIQVFNGELYALDSEGVKVIDPAAFTVSRSLTAGNLSPRNLRVANNRLYYTSGTSAYSVEPTATALSEQAIFDYSTTSQFGIFYGFAVNGDNIFVGDAGDFSSDGEVFIYSTDGQLLRQLEAGGVAPNSFYFQ